MACLPVNNENGKIRMLPAAASQTVVKGDCLVWSSGQLATISADGEIVDYVAAETLSAATTANQLIAVYPARTGDILFEVDCTSNTATAQQGTDVEWTNKSTLKNATTASANGFRIEQAVGAAADKKVRGKFVPS